MWVEGKESAFQTEVTACTKALRPERASEFRNRKKARDYLVQWNMWGNEARKTGGA